MTLKKCTQCGKIFGLDKPDGRITRCKECTKGKYVKTAKRRASCAYCGKMFIQGRSTQLYCSTFCRLDHYREVYETATGTVEVICPWCKEKFTTTSRQRKYCCVEHYKEAKVARDRERIKQGIPKHS